MKRQRSGVILVTASTSAIRPRPGVQSYSASKGAVVALTKSLALELAPFGVRAVAIAPVATETPMLPRFSGKEQVDDGLMQKYLPTIPLGRLNTAGGRGADRAVPGLGRRRDDHGRLPRGGRGPLHLTPGPAPGRPYLGRFVRLHARPCVRPRQIMLDDMSLNPYLGWGSLSYISKP